MTSTAGLPTCVNREETFNDQRIDALGFLGPAKALQMGNFMIHMKDDCYHRLWREVVA
jgi:hypothetical protein